MINEDMANSKKAKALDQYEGAMILVSRLPDFVKQICIDEMLDLEKQ